MRITVDEYERAKRQELILNKMRHLIDISVDVTDLNSAQQMPTSDERSVNMLRETMLSEIREKAMRSYIDGLKKNIKIKIDTKLIS